MKEYLEFLKTEFWMDMARECKRLAGWRCVRCGSRKGLQAHHRIYRATWLETRLDDLECLCWRCHQARHGFKVAYLMSAKAIENNRKGRLKAILRIRMVGCASHKKGLVSRGSSSN